MTDLKRNILMVAMLSVLLLQALYASSEVSNNAKKIAQTVIDDAIVTPQMLATAEQFRNALTNNGTKPASVYVYSGLTVDNYPGIQGAKTLAARMVLMGYTDILLAVHPEGNNLHVELRNKEWIKAFNKYLNQYDVKVHALLFSEPSQFGPNREKNIDIHSSIVQQFNKTVEPSERFLGASADWEPHSLTINNPYSGDEYEGEEGAGLAIEDRWANDRYTIGGANDRLLERLGTMLSYTKISLEKFTEPGLPKLTLNEAINYHVQEQFDWGNIAHGDLTTYIGVDKCEDINVMAYNYRKEEIWKRAESVLTSGDRNNLPKSVYVCIKTRLGDDEGPTTSLKPQGWNYLIETLKFLHSQASQFSSMKGISMYEYSDTEDMWMTESGTVVEAEFDVAEKQGLYDFLVQESAIVGQKNYERVGLTGADIATAPNDNAWMEKLITNKAIHCTGIIAKNVTRITMKNKGLSGSIVLTAFNALEKIDLNSNEIKGITLPEGTVNELHIGYNKLTTLDLSKTNIQLINCKFNNLFSIKYNLTINPGFFDVSNNHLNFSNLPNPTLAYPEAFLYAPQGDISGEEVNYDDVIDLSHMFSIYGNNTQYTWTSKVKDLGDGKFEAGVTNKNKTLVCTMTNASFPDLSIKYTIKINDAATPTTGYDSKEKQALYDFLMGESAVAGKKNHDQLGLTAEDMSTAPNNNEWMDKLVDNISIIVDENNPKRILEFKTENASLAGTVDFSSFQVLTKVYLKNNAISEVQVPSSLKVLSISNNKLSSIDLEEALVADLLDISYNQFVFSTLPVEGLLTQIFTYAPQDKIDRGSIDFDETIDLSKEFSIGENTTEYTWSSEVTDLGDGKFEAGVTNKNKTLVCTMTNASFPDLSIEYTVKINDTATPTTGYDRKEKQALYDFLMGESAVARKKNYDQLGLTAEDMTDAPLSDKWMDKLIANNVISGVTKDGLISTTHMLMKYRDLAGELDLSNFKQMVDVELTGSQLTELILPTDVAMNGLFVTYNKLENIDLSRTTIESISLRYNEIKNIKYNDVSSKYLDISNNRLSFSTLPDPANFDQKELIYAPQIECHGGELDYNDIIDLSKEFLVLGNETSYEWSSEVVDLGNGKFEAGIKNENSVLTCIMTNGAYPDLELRYIVQISDVARHDATLHNLLLGGKALDNIAVEMTYVIPKDYVENDIDLRLEFAEGATITAIPTLIDISKPSIQSIEFTITSASGKNSIDYSLQVEKRFKFEELVNIQWNNTLTVTNNNTSAYLFTAYQWYKNGQAIEGATKSSYSVDEEKGVLSKHDSYYVEVTEAISQKVLRTWEATPNLSHSSVLTYPNPALKNETVVFSVDADEELLNGAKIYVYNTLGGLVKSQDATGILTNVDMPATSGIYILMLKGAKGFTKTSKVIVK